MLEILAVRSGPLGKAFIQESFGTPTQVKYEPTYPHLPSSPRSHERTHEGAGDHQGNESLARKARGKDANQEAKHYGNTAELKGIQQEPQSRNINHASDSHCFDRDLTPSDTGSASSDNVAADDQIVHRGASDGAASFALEVADAWSRADSRTIVGRGGAARTTASALSLLRAILTDVEMGGEEKRTEDDMVPPWLSVSSAANEFIEKKVSEILQRAQ